MKHFLSPQTGLAAAAIGVAWMLTMPAASFAQANRGGGGSSGGGGAPAGGSSGAVSGGGGDRGSSSGGGGGFAGGSSARDSGGNRAGATGGSGMAMPRASGGDHSGAGNTPRYAGGPAARTTGRTADNAGTERAGVPANSRPRDPNAPTLGKAVPRPEGSTPTRGGGVISIVPAGYYGGYGLGYGYGGYGGFFGGYYDPWYDPWYGAYPTYGGGYQTPSDEGALRLKIKPKDAEVYVDGYFEGAVDDFDGIFQRLHLDAGVHRIEVRAAGYEPLTFEVRISADHTTTYQGEMRRIP